MGTTPRVAIYVRVSTLKQDLEGTSPETQEAECRAYAEREGWEIVGVYQDIHTGAELYERPALTQIRTLAREGKFDILLSYAVDRLTRNQAHLYILAEELDTAGVQLAFVTESFEDSPDGKFILSAKAFAAEVEREKLRERSIRGIRARVESGKPIVGRKAPFGYVWADEAKSRLVEDPETAGIVREMYERLASGESLHRIADALMERGIPTPSGRSMIWRRSTIRQIVTNPCYKGEVRAYRTEYVKVRTKDGRKVKRAIPRPESEQIILTDVAPPLVSAELWDEANKALEWNKILSARNNRKPHETLLRGFVYCAYCGRRMTVHRHPSGAPVYRCMGNDVPGACSYPSIRTHILDAAVWEALIDVLTRPDSVAAFSQEARAALDATEGELAALDKTLSELERRRKNFLAGIGQAASPEVVASLVAELERIGEQIQAVEVERARVVEAQRKREEAWHRLQELTTVGDQLRASLEAMTTPERVRLLRMLGVRVTVARDRDDDRDRATLDFDLPLLPSPMGIVYSSASITVRNDEVIPIRLILLPRQHVVTDAHAAIAAG